MSTPNYNFNNFKSCSPKLLAEKMASPFHPGSLLTNVPERNLRGLIERCQLGSELLGEIKRDRINDSLDKQIFENYQHDYNNLNPPIFDSSPNHRNDGSQRASVNRRPRRRGGRGGRGRGCNRRRRSRGRRRGRRRRGNTGNRCNNELLSSPIGGNVNQSAAFDRNAVGRRPTPNDRNRSYNDVSIGSDSRYNRDRSRFTMLMFAKSFGEIEKAYMDGMIDRDFVGVVQRFSGDSFGYRPVNETEESKFFSKALDARDNQEWNKAIRMFLILLKCDRECAKYHCNLAVALFYYTQDMVYNYYHDKKASIKGSIAGNMAVLWNIRHMFQDSIRCFESALVYDPANVDVLYNFATVLWTLQRFDEAKRWLEQVLDRDSTHHGSRWLLGRIFMIRCQYANAEFHFSKLMMQYNSDTTIYYLAWRAILLCEMGETERALEMCTDYGKCAPFHSFGNVAYAVALSYNNEIYKSARLFEDAISNFPANAELHFRYARHLQRHRLNENRCELHFKRAVELSPLCSEYYWYYGRLLKDIGKTRRGKKLIGVSRELDPSAFLDSPISQSSRSCSSSPTHNEDHQSIITDETKEEQLPQPPRRLHSDDEVAENIAAPAPNTPPPVFDRPVNRQLPIVKASITSKDGLTTRNKLIVAPTIWTGTRFDEGAWGDDTNTAEEDETCIDEPEGVVATGAAAKIIIDLPHAGKSPHFVKFCDWLVNTVELGQYLRNFQRNGYADIRLLDQLDDVTLKLIGIPMIGHRRLLLKYALYGSKST